MIDAKLTHRDTPNQYDSEYWEDDAGWKYFMDDNHIGCLFFKDEHVAKYDLDLEELEELDPADNEDDIKAGYKYSYTLIHCAYAIDPDGVEYVGNEQTPHGELYGPEFVAWWNDLPPEVMDDETVYEAGWCDG